MSEVDDKIKRRFPMKPQHIVNEIRRIQLEELPREIGDGKQARDRTTEEWLTSIQKNLDIAKASIESHMDPRARLLAIGARIFAFLETDGPL